MSHQPKGSLSETTSLSGDLLGGLTAMLVALPSSIAFGVLVYTILGREYVGQGAMAGAIGAAAIGLLAPLFGRTDGLISAPCAPAAAVLSALATSLIAGQTGAKLAPDNIVASLALAALFSALLQIGYGALGGGKLIKFIPYPVVSGYLSGVAVIIILGQLPKLFGLPKDTPLLHGLLSPTLWKWPGLVVGIVTIVVMLFASRLTEKIPSGILGLIAGMATYWALTPFVPALRTLENNPLVIGSLQASGGFFNTILSSAQGFFAIDAAMIKLVLIPALTLSILLSIDTLKTCVVLDALTQKRHNSNRELIGQGLGNLGACLLGGMPGAGTMGPSLVNVSSGGRTPRSGIAEGVGVILTLVIFQQMIAWVPLGALAGIMIVIAGRMFDRQMFRLWRYPAGRVDFAVILVVIIVAVTVDLIAASGVGVACAILLFIRDQIHGTVIRRKVYLNQISSKTRRLAHEREMLARLGEQGVFCELQGNLFFGTTDQLFSQLEPDLRTKRFILLDMRRVQSMDYTAAHLFEQMQARLAKRDGQLLFSGMPSALLDQRNFEHYLVELGVVGESGGVMIAETLDSALEWIEERILASAGLTKNGDESLLEVRDFELFRSFDDAALSKISACLREVSLTPGQKIFSAGDQDDEIFLVRRGSVRIMLPLEGGKRHHLTTVGQGNFFGELSFLDRGVRSADVEAKVSTELYALSRARFDEQTQADAEIGVQVFAQLALAIANHLRRTDAELQVLQER